MLTAVEALERANRQELVDNYLKFVEDTIKEKADNGRTEVGIDFDGDVSQFLKDKVKEILEENGYDVKVFPGPNGGMSMGISWGREEDGEEVENT